MMMVCQVQICHGTKAKPGSAGTLAGPLTKSIIRRSIMAAQNTTFEFNLNADQQAVFGIVLNNEGIVEEIKAGSFSSSDADAMADHLVLLAARIRNAAYAAEAAL